MRKIFFFIISALFTLSVNATDYFVDAARPDDTGDGLTWETAKKTIDAAAALATNINPAPYNNVYVKAGTYAEIAALLYNRQGMSVYGGYPAANAVIDITNRDIVANATILDGGAVRTGFSINKGGMLVDGFTVQNCKQTGYARGAGISLANAGAKVSNCIIKNNTMNSSVKINGAGVYISSGATVENCEIYGNATGAVGSGGGVYIDGGNLLRCKVYNNTGGTYCGGVMVAATQNNAIDKVLNANVVVANCLIYNNNKEGLYVSSVATNAKTVKIINNTVVNNALPIVISDVVSLVSGANNIFYNNTSDETFATGTAFTYNAIQAASVTGTGNIALASGNQATLFTSPTATTGIIADASSNWLPTSGSGLYNIGDNTAVVGTVDNASNIRIQQTTVDLGALETSLLTGINTLNGNSTSQILVMNGGVKIQNLAPVQVYNFSGKVVWSGLSNGETIALPQGAYIVRATLGQNVEVKKVIIN